MAGHAIAIVGGCLTGLMLAGYLPLAEVIREEIDHKVGCHIGHSYTAEVMASAQLDELEKVMRAAVRFLNERAEFCLQMAESSGPGSSPGWHAASKQALDRAYKLRDLVEQDWITPETSGEPVAGKPTRRVNG